MKRPASSANLILLAILFSTALKAQRNISEWKIIGAGNEIIQSNTSYRLNNSRANSYLAYYHRNIGISLAFDIHQQSANVKFVKEDGSTGPIRFDEKIAIHIEGGGFIYYIQKPAGINLDYGSKPICEWKFKDNSFGPQRPGFVKGNDLIALFNSENDGFMVYGTRSSGPNLDWSDQPSTSLIPNTRFKTCELLLSLKAGPFATPAPTARCTGRIIWTFTPVKLTGTEGEKDKVFSIDKYYESMQLNTGVNVWWCFYTEVVTGLKAGTWKVLVQTPEWSTECVVEISGLNNPVLFEVNKKGCTDVFQTQPAQFQPIQGPKPATNRSNQ